MGNQYFALYRGNILVGTVYLSPGTLSAPFKEDIRIEPISSEEEFLRLERGLSEELTKKYKT